MAGDLVQVMGVGDAASGFVAVGFEVRRADGTVLDEVDLPHDVLGRLRRAAVEASRECMAARAEWATGQRPVAFIPVAEDDPLVQAIRPVLDDYSRGLARPASAPLH